MGIAGKSPYQISVAGKYSGAEEDFNAQLVAAGEATIDFNAVNAAKQEFETAKENVFASILDIILKFGSTVTESLILSVDPTENMGCHQAICQHIDQFSNRYLLLWGNYPREYQTAMD